MDRDEGRITGAADTPWHDEGHDREANIGE
jgi:hypothetical protein